MNSRKFRNQKFLSNTSISTRWAMKNFSDWFESYNSKNSDDLCPDKLLHPSCDTKTLNKWLCAFVYEIMLVIQFVK